MPWLAEVSIITSIREPAIPRTGDFSRQRLGRSVIQTVVHGQNIETEAMQGHIRRICNECGIQREGSELYRWLQAPLDATDVHVFTEGLVGLSQLHLLK